MNRNRNTDLSQIKGTIGYVFKNNRDELLAVKSSDEAYNLVSKLFRENNINTPASRRILFNLRRGMNYTRTVNYLNNIIMSSQGLGVMESNEVMESNDLWGVIESDYL